MNDSIIANYYLENNYPRADKLHKIAKKNNVILSLSKIKEWFAKQETEQIMKPVIKKNKWTCCCL